MHIGEVAERVGLSLRTIRYYEEVGLINPSARTQGGFRLYADADATRLQLIKDMKPLGFSLDEMRDLLGVLDHLDQGQEPGQEPGQEQGQEPGQDREQEPGRDGDGAAMAQAQAALIERLAMYRAAAEARCDTLRGQLRIAESFAGTLSRRLAPHR